MANERQALEEIYEILQNDRLRAIGKLDSIAEVVEGADPGESWEAEEEETGDEGADPGESWEAEEEETGDEEDDED